MTRQSHESSSGITRSRTTFSPRTALALAGAACLATLALVGAGGANAATVIFPAGFACSFDLNVTGVTDARLHHMVFERPDGNSRILDAGIGGDVAFSRTDGTGSTFTAKGNGAVGWQTVQDGRVTHLTLTGHYVIFYFSTDRLLDNNGNLVSGPATLLVIGRESIDIDAAGNFTEVSRSGNVTDICAAVSTPQP
jgi:hypothetical protein